MINKTIKKRAKRSKIWDMPHNELVELTKNSSTIGDILKVFGLENKGGNHQTIKRRLDEEQIDYSHIPLGLNANKGRKFNIKPLDFEELFKINSSHSRLTVKRYILKHNLIPYKCDCCGFEGKWQNKELVLVLDHINGVPNDHRLENVRFLCPNCNSQQETFSGKNNKKEKNRCIDCGKIISKKSFRCQSCASKYMKKDICKRPSKEQLMLDIQEMNNIKIGLKYNVSEASIRKWRKKYNI